MYFINLNKSPMTLAVPKWQDDVIARINSDEDVISEAIKISEEFKNRVLSINAAEGYFGTAVHNIELTTPRYMYIKNIDAGSDRKYVAQIDLLHHTVQFDEQ